MDKNSSKTIDRLVILNRIFELLCKIEFDINGLCLGGINHNLIRTETLIEILEGADCGSYGGYDEESPTLKDEMFLFALFGRFSALVRKYNDEKNIIPLIYGKNKKCDFKELKKRFQKIKKY